MTNQTCQQGREIHSYHCFLFQSFLSVLNGVFLHRFAKKGCLHCSTILCLGKEKRGSNFSPFWIGHTMHGGGQRRPTRLRQSFCIWYFYPFLWRWKNGAVCNLRDNGLRLVLSAHRGTASLCLATLIKDNCWSLPAKGVCQWLYRKKRYIHSKLPPMPAVKDETFKSHNNHSLRFIPLQPVALMHY